MTFKESVKFCMGPGYFFRFQGRASRSQYWWFALFLAPFNLADELLGHILPETPALIITMAICIAFFPANIGVSVRRLHDRNLSGWWLLPLFLAAILGFVALVLESGSAIFIFLSLMLMVVAYLGIMVTPSQKGPNRYGEAPDMGIVRSSLPDLPQN